MSGLLNYSQSQLEDVVEDAAVVLVVQAQLSDVDVGLVQHVPMEWRLLLLLFRSLSFGLLLEFLLHEYPLLLPLQDRRWHNRAFLPLPASFECKRANVLQCLQLLNSSHSLRRENRCIQHVLKEGIDVYCTVVYFPEVGDDGDKVVIFFLHLLVVAAALFGLARAHEDFHGLEDLIHPAHVSIDKMLVMDLQKPMILFVLLRRPVPPVHVFTLLRSLTTTPHPFSPLRHWTPHVELGWRMLALRELQVSVQWLRRRSGRKRVGGGIYIFFLLVFLVGVEGKGVHMASRISQNNMNINQIALDHQTPPLYILFYKIVPIKTRLF